MSAGAADAGFVAGVDGALGADVGTNQVPGRTRIGPTIAEGMDLSGLSVESLRQHIHSVAVHAG